MIFYTPDSLVRLHFYIGTAGLVDANFTKTLFNNGAASAEIVTVGEIGSGYYVAAFTPEDPSSHYWLEVYRTGSNIRFTESFQDRRFILDQICEVEGEYTAQQILSTLLAGIAGRTTDDGATFKTPNNNATRIAGAVDANDNRTSITLTPSS